MKKTLITVLAVMLVVASLVGGSMALYTTSIDDVSTGDMTGKYFYVGSNTVANFAEDLTIAPTETASATFKITNTNDSKISEVDIDVTMTLKLTITSATSTTLALPEDMEVTITAASASLTKEGDVYTFTMAKNAKFDDTFTVTFNWNTKAAQTANEADNAYIGATFAYSIDIVGTQKASA